MPRNEELPGVEGPGVSPVKVKALDEAFDELLGARKRRMDWGKKEKDAQSRVLELMKKHEVEVYYYDETPYEIVDIEKVRRKPKDEEENSNGD